MMTSYNSLKNIYLSEIKTDIEKYSDFSTETIKEKDVANDYSEKNGDFEYFKEKISNIEYNEIKHERTTILRMRSQPTTRVK